MAARTVNTKELVEELKKGYKNIIKTPPNHGDLILVVHPSRRSGGYTQYLGTYDAFNQTIKISYHGPKKVSEQTYWIPAPGIPDELLNYTPEKPLSAIEYYDTVTSKKRGFPKIAELYRCEMYLRRGCISLYGTGFNPPRKELLILKDKMGSYFLREGIEAPRKADAFKYFLHCYEKELMNKHIYDYDELVYRTSPR